MNTQKMELKVYHRNVNAREEFKEAKKAALKALQREGFKEYLYEFDEAVATVGSLKQTVIEKLRGHPIAQDVPLQEKDIWVFKKDETCSSKDETSSSNTAGKLVPLSETDQLCAGATYAAFEVFTVLPTDMYRTVRMDQLFPATLCLPERSRAFTSVSPLWNAALTLEEETIPWFGWSGEGNPNVHGISVFCENPATPIVEENYNPFSASTVQTEKDLPFSVALENYQDLPGVMGDDNKYADPVLGVVCSSLSHTERGGEFAQGKSTIKFPDKTERTQHRLATEQCVFLRYKIPKGTDLKKHCIAAVYDNMALYEEYHCTLVREQKGEKRKPGQGPGWIRHNAMMRGSAIALPMPPDGYVLLDRLLDDDERLVKLLRPLDSLDQPEYLPLDGVMYLPCLAAEFELHDFVIKARAGPVPLDNFGDDENGERLFLAASILFSVTCGGEDVYQAIQVLETAGYAVDCIGDSTRKVLIDEMEKVDDRETSKLGPQDMEGWGADPITDPYDALSDGIEILCRAPQEEAPKAKSYRTTLASRDR